MTDDPLTRPVYQHVESLDLDVPVRPVDVLAALDDEQREALRLHLLDNVPSLTGYHARAVVDAICGEQA